MTASRTACYILFFAAGVDSAGIKANKVKLAEMTTGLHGPGPILEQATEQH